MVRLRWDRSLVGGGVRGQRCALCPSLAAVLLIAIAAAPSRAEPPEVAGPPAAIPQHIDPPTATEHRPLGRAVPAGPREAAPLGGTTAGPGVGSSGGLGAARTVLSLGLVLGLAVAAGATVKRLARAQGGLAGSVGAGGAAPAGILEIIGRYPIARGQRLVLLRIDRRILLLSHVAPSRLSRGGGFSTLCEITDADEVASILTKSRDAEGDSLAAKFQSLLGRYGGGGGDEEADDADGEPPELRTVKLGPDGRAGDRAELWDDQPMRLVPEPPRPREENDAVSAIRRRLEAMRSTTLGGGGRA